ncbi:MAG: glutamate--tRNA ligase [Patescibacteria group bacterium]
MENKVKTRFAPSPTGFFHIGSARTALFNYLYAKKHGGDFILRIEDTDRERSKPEYESDIKESLSWLTLDWDIYHKQSDRTQIYQEAVRKLIEKNRAYVSKEGDKEEAGKRSEVIRFRNPNTVIEFQDKIRGDIKFDTSDLGDFVIAKSEEEPLYHLTVVVDDHEMEISHVIRAEEHISNTPRQILILEALGYDRPEYAHIPLILAPDRSKLSKRHGAVSVMEYRDKGFLPEALVNYLALLGWNPGTDQEIFEKEDLIKQFSLDAVQKGGSIFSEEKLRWVNKSHLLNFVSEDKQYEEFKRRFTASSIPEKKCWQFSDDYLHSIWKVFKERISVYEDIDILINEGEFDYFFEKPEEYAPQGLLWKDQDEEEAKRHLESVYEKLLLIDEEEFKDEEKVKKAIWDYATEQGRGNVLWPMRYALTGAQKSPDPFSLASVFGKEESLQRVEIAISKLKNNN